MGHKVAGNADGGNASLTLPLGSGSRRLCRRVLCNDSESAHPEGTREEGRTRGGEKREGERGKGRGREGRERGREERERGKRGERRLTIGLVLTLISQTKLYQRHISY